MFPAQRILSKGALIRIRWTPRRCPRVGGGCRGVAVPGLGGGVQRRGGACVWVGGCRGRAVPAFGGGVQRRGRVFVGVRGAGGTDSRENSWSESSWVPSHPSSMTR